MQHLYKCVFVCSPVESIGVQVQDLQWSSIRFISQLMNHQPLFILSYYTNLKCRERMGRYQQLNKLSKLTGMVKHVHQHQDIKQLAKQNKTKKPQTVLILLK